MEKEDIANKNTISISNIYEQTSQTEYKDTFLKTDKKPSNNPTSKKEIIVTSEDLELKENTIIKAQKVILNMVKVQTNEHSLIILADEFLSNHSVIQNFQEDQKAKKKEDGKHGGNTLILAYKASGNLKLILNGENGGKVSKRRVITKEERQELSGSNGKNGRDAVYKRYCKETYLYLPVLPPLSEIIKRASTSKRCWWECVLRNERGENGGKGKRGLRGEDGRHGGDTGFFHLRAFDVLDFHLEEVKKSKGLGSKGGKGSSGGFGGRAGRNGKDYKNLCGEKLSRLKRGNKGKRGSSGKAGKNGVEKLVCLE
ncbi:MAG: hypothetical protein OXJ52_09365, partial [Oligoflexia bacterium]|nr:hypothetical protein [Oligoflexia bacterium]